MPNRILREGILTSPRISRVGWAEEVLYRRLHSVVDDFGRYYADPGMLRAACYPRQLSKVSDSDIGKWLQVIADAGLVRVYPASDGERYLEVLDFGQQVRSKKSKFPDQISEDEAAAQHLRSTCAADATQLPANARLDVSESEVVSESVGGKRAQARATSPARPDDVGEQVWADWLRLRKDKRAPVTDTVVSQARIEAGKAKLSLERFLAIWCARGSQGLQAEWLRDSERSGGSNGPKSFRERDAEHAAAEVAKWGGGRIADRGRRTQETIEMEATHGRLDQD